MHHRILHEYTQANIFSKTRSWDIDRCQSTQMQCNIINKLNESVNNVTILGCGPDDEHQEDEEDEEAKHQVVDALPTCVLQQSHTPG